VFDTDGFSLLYGNSSGVDELQNTPTGLNTYDTDPDCISHHFHTEYPDMKVEF